MPGREATMKMLVARLETLTILAVIGAALLTVAGIR
jgi:hypothetical protein